ncbi:hypothetical protein ACTFIY_008927 [Dictyostelium cf. discoideum]
MFYIQLIIFLIIFSFISLSFGQLALEEKESIDILLNSYNLLPISNNNYCELPQYFLCDTTNSTILKINLNGDFNNFTIFPNGTIDKFPKLKDISIKNSVLSSLFFDEIPPLLKTLDLDNCSISSFPNKFNGLNSLSMNDVDFDGDIPSFAINGLFFFKLTYSSSDKIKNYQILKTNETQNPKNINEHIITVNNIVYNPFDTYGYLKFILGKYFIQDSFNEIGNMTTKDLSIIDIGHFNKQITIPLEITSKSDAISFKNIQFNIDDPEYINFNNNQIFSLAFFNCSGLINSNEDIKINVLGSLKFFVFINSNLKKIPYFYIGLGGFDLSNNQIIGELPDIEEPEKNQNVRTINLSNNLIQGTIPPNYCFHGVILSNNSLTGDLPMCFICQLNDEYSRNRINGNNFNNYISGSTNGFPICSGVKFTSNALFSPGHGSIEARGINFGWQPNNFNQETIFSTPELKMTISIPNKEISSYGYYNGLWERLEKSNFTSNVRFKIPNLNATLKFDVLPPTFSDVMVNPYVNLGYAFTIIGQGISTFGYNSTVYIDDFTCIYFFSSTAIIRCIVYQPQLPEKIYKITVFNNQTKLTGTYQYKFERLYPFIISVNPSTIQGGLVSLYGSFGTNSTDVTLFIGDQQCQNISFDPLLIKCTIGPGVGVHSINITVDGVNWVGKNIYTFLLEKPICPGDNKQCNGNGECVNGNCFCFSGFGGLMCSNVIETSIDIKKNDTLIEMIKNGYSFGFSIKDIREIDITEKVVRQHNFTKWTLTADSTLQKWTYKNKIGNSIISYTIEQIIGEAKNYTFAGELITLQPGSLKLSANISNWEYLGSLNTLQLRIQSSVKAQQENECKQTSNIQSNGNGFSLNYITIQKDKNIFSGRFIDKVVSDGRPTFSKVSISEQTEDSITVSISLPYCKECLIDPDFSVMINPDIPSNPCSNDQPSKLKWVIPVSVILGLLGLFGIFAIVFFLARDRIYISRKGGIIILKKIKKSSKMNE